MVEEEGRVVACAGLWDRGRDVRERWRHKLTGEERAITVTALMDFGFEAGHERSMVRLIAYLIGETDRLGRDYLLAALQHLPRVSALLEDYKPIEETRGSRLVALGRERSRAGQARLADEASVHRPRVLVAQKTARVA